MPASLSTVCALLVVGGIAQPAVARTASSSAVPMAGAVVYVAPPTGEREIDRASILAALP